MAKMKVLTVQFDVTDLPQEAIDELRFAVEVQGEDFVADSGAKYEADHLRSGISVVDVEDM
jgi:hypothetical protein